MELASLTSLSEKSAYVKVDKIDFDFLKCLALFKCYFESERKTTNNMIEKEETLIYS